MHNNLRKQEHQALLQSNPNIVIRQTDKGGGIVILNKEEYIAKAQRLLSDQETYTKLGQNPIQTFKRELLFMVNAAQEDGILNPSERSFLCPNFFAIQYFYYLPKVHKDSLHSLGRPIIAAIDGLNSHLSDYVDFFLQPIVQQLPAYIQDSSHLLDTLNCCV